MQVLEQGRLNLQLGVTPNGGRVRSSTCKSRAEAPTSACSGAHRAVVGGAPAPTTNPTRTGRRQTTGARSNDNRNALQQEAPGVADPETRRASK